MDIQDKLNQALDLAGRTRRIAAARPGGFSGRFGDSSDRAPERVAGSGLAPTHGDQTNGASRLAEAGVRHRRGAVAARLGLSEGASLYPWACTGTFLCPQPCAHAAGAVDLLLFADQARVQPPARRPGRRADSHWRVLELAALRSQRQRPDIDPGLSACAHSVVVSARPGLRRRGMAGQSESHRLSALQRGGGGLRLPHLAGRHGAHRRHGCALRVDPDGHPAMVCGERGAVGPGGGAAGRHCDRAAAGGRADARGAAAGADLQPALSSHAVGLPGGDPGATEKPLYGPRLPDCVQWPPACWSWA